MIGTIMLFSVSSMVFSDGLIGHLVDRTHSKHGKSRMDSLDDDSVRHRSHPAVHRSPATPIVKGIYVSSPITLHHRCLHRTQPSRMQR